MLLFVIININYFDTMSNIKKWLSLARATGIKNETVRFAIDQYGFDPDILKEKIIEHSKNAGCFDKIKFGSEDKIDAEIESVNKIGAKMISIDSNSYPDLLKKIYNAPLVITVKGNTKLLNKQNIAIVGSRQPTFHSQSFAMEISLDLSSKFCITSGMAVGIDSAVHVSALKNNNTIGVLGSGINVVYPPENQELYELICENGLMISQYSFETPPRAGNFPIRNQVIAGISLATIVIEAYRNSPTGRSGSLITAEFAKHIGRFVYTIPGFPTKDGRFSGNNYLLKEKIAVLIENSDDMLEHLRQHMVDVAKEPNIQISDNNDINTDDINITKFKILSTLHVIPMSIDELAIATGCKISLIRATLIELELSGLIVRGFDGKVIKV